jgi:predicted ATPase
MNKEIVVLIGGPSSGKTTLIKALKEKGHTCYPEVSREVIKEAQEQGIEQLFLENPLLFSELLLEGRKKQFNNAVNEEANLVFLDRGIPDVLAYMHYIGDAYPAFFDQACKEHKYNAIFMLPPWEEIYVSDAERYESYEQAVLIHDHLMETYKKYGYTIIEVPRDSIENRIDFIMKQLTK